jgi:hypothetical protein
MSLTRTVLTGSRPAQSNTVNFSDQGVIVPLSPAPSLVYPSVACAKAQRYELIFRLNTSSCGLGYAIDSQETEGTCRVELRVIFSLKSREVNDHL